MTVELDRTHVRARVEQCNRQRSDTRTDLNNPIAGRNTRESNDAFRGVRVGEKVLPERLAWTDAMLGEQPANLGDRERHTRNNRVAFAAVTRATSSTDSPRARANASPTATTNAGSFCFPR